jgi:hypothetical protein
VRAAQFAALGARGPAFAVALMLFACGGRAHIEPLGPTVAPSAGGSPGTAASDEPPGTAPNPSGVPTTLPSAAPPAPDKPRSACTHGGASALSELACELASGMGSLPAPVTVAAGPLAGAAPHDAELATRIAISVAAALGSGARALNGAVSLELAMRSAGTSRTLVDVSPELARGRLRLSAAAYLLASAPSAPRASADVAARRAEASRRLDGELGQYLPKIALAVTRTERAAAGTDIVALACGDVTGKDEPELVTVGRRRLQVGRMGDGHFTARAETAWASLSPVAPSPLREPIGGVVVVTGDRVLAGLSDRADGVALSTSLAPLGRLEAPLPWEHVGCLSRTGTALGAPRPCTRGAASVVDVSAADGIDAFASGMFVDVKGKVVRVVAWRTPRSREVTLRDDAGRMASAGVAGSALALADLDLDGQPELVASVDTDDPAADAMVVSTWGRDGAVTERLRVPVKEGVHALAVCPADDVRMARLVAATGGGLWLAE